MLESSLQVGLPRPYLCCSHNSIAALEELCYNAEGSLPSVLLIGVHDYNITYLQRQRLAASVAVMMFSQCC